MLSSPWKSIDSSSLYRPLPESNLANFPQQQSPQLIIRAGRSEPSRDRPPVWSHGLSIAPAEGDMFFKSDLITCWQTACAIIGMNPYISTPFRACSSLEGMLPHAYIWTLTSATSFWLGFFAGPFELTALHISSFEDPMVSSPQRAFALVQQPSIILRV